MIHPRRLKGAPANIARYYTVGDYYTEGADEHSEWGGALAADLGLSGRVDPAVFRELLAGKVAGQQLVRHRHEGGIEHHSGWDFAVNAPKSVSIVLLVGIAGYAGRRFPSARLPLAIAGLAAGGILLSIAGLVVLAAAMAGVSPDAVDRATIVMVLGATVAGTAWILRIVALTAVLALARHPLAAGLAGAVALATLGWSGHGAMVGGMLGWVHLVADIVQMIAAARWIGVPALLAWWLPRAPGRARVARTHALAAGFAGVGTVLVAVIVPTGAADGWLLVGSPSGLTGTLYGRLLLARLALFGTMLGLAAVDGFRLTPAPVVGDDPTRAWAALRRSVVPESGCGVGVLVPIAWAGTLAPGG